MNYLTVKELPELDRPYEKCEIYGPEFLSDAELIAVIIRTGSRYERSDELAKRLLAGFNAYKGLEVLNHISYHELLDIKGIGRVKAIQLLCVAEISKRLGASFIKRGEVFNNDEKVAGYYMQRMRVLAKEEVVLVMLDTKSRLIADKVISVGTINASLVSAREIFYEALKNNAAGIILLHNHPSGDPMPSTEDIKLTKSIFEAGNLMCLPLLDHIIIGDKKYLSLKKEGYI